ncbi:MAG: hypothetical protein WCR63_05695 [Bacilli bacterium]
MEKYTYHLSKSNQNYYIDGNCVIRMVRNEPNITNRSSGVKGVYRGKKVGLGMQSWCFNATSIV